MPSLPRRIAGAAWRGLALAALFFYPLIVTLDSDSYYLHWQPGDIVEVAASLLVLGAVCATVVFLTWHRSTRMATAVLLAASAIPVASLVSGIARQLPFEDELIRAWGNPLLPLAIPGAAVVVVIAAFITRPVLVATWSRRVLTVLSPVAILVLVTLGMSTQLGSTVRAHAQPTVRRQGSETTCPPILALLFDELSFSYLYDNEGNIDSRFPRLAVFGAGATHYTAVRAPDRETLTAVPSFLAARHINDARVEGGELTELSSEGHRVPLDVSGPDGLFATARSLGFQSEVAGYYLAYCELLGSLADACRSLSFYNASSADDRFSIVDPIETTLMLWPRQFPFGVLKGRPFARHQRALVEQTRAFAARPLADDRPIFRFVHFSVPHLPFAFDASGYNPPFDPVDTVNEAGYAGQLAYVDRLAGGLFDGLRREGTYDRATIVVFADHGYRFGGREQDPLRIPFIVKKAGQRDRQVVSTPAAGEELLRQVVQQSCAAY